MGKNLKSLRKGNLISMNLNQTQLTKLKSFISKKGIKHIDVQMEILDHMASAIEYRMSSDQRLSFEDAIAQTNASFGIFGISELENAIISGLSKKYSKIFWKQFLSLFGLRYIGIVLICGFLIYQAQLMIRDYNDLLLFFLSLTFMLLGLLFLWSFKFRKIKNFRIYTTSKGYLAHVSSFFLIFNFAISQPVETSLYGVNLNLAFSTIILLLFLIYVFASIRTALHGIKESKELNIKYLLLDY